MSEISTKKESFFRRYRGSILAAVIIFLLVVYPNIVQRLNPPPPEEKTEVLRGVILHAQREHSNVLLKLPDGQVQALDFPGELQGVYGAMWARFTYADPAELQLLVGCPAEVRVDTLRLLFIPSNPRIWSLQCDRYSIPYDKMVDYYKRRTDFLLGTLFVFFVSIILLLLTIRRDFKNSNRDK
jgi:hypothetical protein